MIEIDAGVERKQIEATFLYHIPLKKRDDYWHDPKKRPGRVSTMGREGVRRR